MAHVLVVDDDLAIREMVALALRKAGHEVHRAGTVAEARRVLAGRIVDLVVCDIYMPGENGLALLEHVRTRPSPPPVILMTARGTVETAALASRFGAFDYLAKPFDVAVLLARAAAALAPAAAPATAPEEGPASMIVGSHPAIVEVYKAVARVAPLPVAVLVLGETGTGKELVARALHAFGAHPQGPFVAVNSGAIPDTLLESELFGHVRGAFTDARRDRRGALARGHGGTVFLDEIGDISPAFQVKLLRFLQDGVVAPLGAESGETVQTRIIAATHRDLVAAVAAGGFRQDLYYRLAGYEIRLPPLRERLTDLPALVDHFRRRTAAKLGLPPAGPPSQAMLDLLAAHSWPGNVRELEQVVRRLLIDTGGLADLAAASRLVPEPRATAAAQAAAPGTGTLDDAARQHLARVLASTGGNRSAAARILGIERKTLRRMAQRLGIDLDGDHGEGDES